MKTTAKMKMKKFQTQAVQLLLYKKQSKKISVNTLRPSKNRRILHQKN